MDLLISIIGNAAVDPIFRKKFLDNPVDTIDHYGFVLTKGDFELMQTVFVNLTPAEKEKMEQAFSNLEITLYANLKMCRPPCYWSVYPPPEFRTELRKVS